MAFWFRATGNSCSRLFRAIVPAWKAPRGTSTICGRQNIGKSGPIKSFTPSIAVCCCMSRISAKDKEFKMTDHRLAFLLQTAAAAQIAVAVLNLFLVRLMKWEADLDHMPLLVREVFRVHAWFISVTLAIFGAVTWRFADEIAHGGNPIGQWLC